MGRQYRGPSAPRPVATATGLVAQDDRPTKGFHPEYQREHLDPLWGLFHQVLPPGTSRACVDTARLIGLLNGVAVAPGSSRKVVADSESIYH